MKKARGDLKREVLNRPAPILSFADNYLRPRGRGRKLAQTSFFPSGFLHRILRDPEVLPSKIGQHPKWRIQEASLSDT